MSDSQKGGQAVAKKWLELAVALFFMGIGAIVVTDSVRTGFKWAADGPEPGYFPFYVGLTIIAAAAWIALQTLLAWSGKKANEAFSTHGELRLVLQMFVPMCVFVVAMSLLGIYIAGLLYIAAFMMWQGKSSVVKSTLVGLVVVAVLYLLFEKWFQVPLPKSPFDTLLGF